MLSASGGGIELVVILSLLRRLIIIFHVTHGLRRGLQSAAALRLGIAVDSLSRE